MPSALTLTPFWAWLYAYCFGGSGVPLLVDSEFLITSSAGSACWTGAVFPIFLNGQLLLKWSPNLHTRYNPLAFWQSHWKCLRFSSICIQTAEGGQNGRLACGALINLTGFPLSTCLNDCFIILFCIRLLFFPPILVLHHGLWWGLGSISSAVDVDFPPGPRVSPSGYHSFR